MINRAHILFHTQGLESSTDAGLGQRAYLLAHVEGWSGQFPALPSLRPCSVTASWRYTWHHMRELQSE